MCYELPLTSLTETGALGPFTSQRPLQLTSAGLTQRASRTGTLQMPLLPYLIRTPWLCRQSYAAQIPTSPPQAWDRYRRELTAAMERALTAGVDWLRALRAMDLIYSDPDIGHPRISQYVTVGNVRSSATLPSPIAC